MFFRLLLESFRRQRRRKLLAGLAILLGTTAVTAMLALATTIGDRIHKELAVYGANIVVTPQSQALAVNIGGTDVRPATADAYLHESDLSKLKTIFWANNITGISPELDWTGEASRQADERRFSDRHDHGVPQGPADLAATPVTVKGLWFKEDFGSLHTGAPSLHPWWHLQGAWPVQHAGTEDTTGAVIGQSLARKLHLHVGDSFSIMTSELYRAHLSNQFTVTGILTANDTTDDAVLVPLSYVQAIAQEPDSITRIDISARTKPEDAFARQDPANLSPAQREIWYCRPYANSIAYQIREAIPGADAQQLRQVEQSEGKVLSRISGLMWLISGAALLAAGFAVSSAMATAVLERRGEIGLMRSLGASRSAIAALFYAETAILALLGGTLGYLAGSTLAALLGARIFPGDAHPSLLTTFNPVLLPVVVGLALLVAVLGSTPSIRAALREDPSAVLRANA